MGCGVAKMLHKQSCSISHALARRATAYQVRPIHLCGAQECLFNISNEQAARAAEHIGKY